MSQSDDINEQEHFNLWSEMYERSNTQWLFFDRVHRCLLRRVPPGFTPAGMQTIGGCQRNANGG